MATKTRTAHWLTDLLLGFILIVSLTTGSRADDTCVFSAASGAVLPNIVVLLDNGAATAVETYPPDRPWISPGGFHCRRTAAPPNGFSCPAISSPMPAAAILCGRSVRIRVAAAAGLVATNSDPVAQRGTWTINGRTVSLPAAASALTDEHGIRDQAGALRYERNYLNWIFFSPAFAAATAGNGSDLPARSRLYHAGCLFHGQGRCQPGKNQHLCLYRGWLHGSDRTFGAGRGQ
jgi:hypothetical protein